MNAEELFTRYRELKAELKMVTYQIAHFKGISESELIDALAFGHNPDEVRVSGVVLRIRPQRSHLTCRIS